MTDRSNVGCESVGSTSSSLLDRVKVRDEAAWQRLVRVYGPLVLYWCRCAGIRVRIASMFAKRYSGRWQSTSTAFDTTSPATRFGVVTDDHSQQSSGPLSTAESTAGCYRWLSWPRAFLGNPRRRRQQRRRSRQPRKAIVVTQVLDLIRNEFEARTWQAFWQATVEAEHPAWSPNRWK